MKMESVPVVPSHDQKDTEPDMLAEFAIDAGLRGVVLPKPGTEAYSRLWEVCKEYSKEVHLEMIGRETDPSESQSRRRMLHNQLCIMLLGADHQAVAKKDFNDITRIANLAHYIAGRDQYVKEITENKKSSR